MRLDGGAIRAPAGSARRTPIPFGGRPIRQKGEDALMTESLLRKHLVDFVSDAQTSPGGNRPPCGDVGMVTTGTESASECSPTPV